MKSREVKLNLIEASVKRQEDPEDPVKLEMLINDIDEANYQTTVETYIKINENEKTQYDN